MSPARILSRLLPVGLLAACAPMTPPVDPDTVNASYCPWETRGWKAWVNAMPGPDAQPTLIVMGEAHVPAGWRAVLIPGPTDRMMPPGQRFSVAMTADEASAGGWMEVRGEIRPALMEYRAVIIGCAGEAVATVEDVETVY